MKNNLNFHQKGGEPVSDVKICLLFVSLNSKHLIGCFVEWSKLFGTQIMHIFVSQMHDLPEECDNLLFSAYQEAAVEMSNTLKHCDGPWRLEEKWTYTSKNFGNFIRKSVWWTKGISRITECTQDAKLEDRKCHILYMWTDRKVTEMDTSCCNTRAIWDSSAIHSTCVSGTLPEYFSFFCLLKAPAAVPWCMLWIDVLDTANKSLGNGMAGSRVAGERWDFRREKGKAILKKISQEKIVSVFSPGLQKHMDFLLAQWQDPIQGEWSMSVPREQILWGGLKWFISVQTMLNFLFPS